MAGAAVLERELNKQDERAAKMRELLFEEKTHEAQDSLSGYDFLRAPENIERTSPSMLETKEEVLENKAPAYNPTLERINSYFEAPVAPRREHDLFKDYQYIDGKLMVKSPDSDVMVPLFENANTVIVEDNAIEYNLNEADEYVAVTKEVVNGIDVSAFPVFVDAQFPDAVYLGVIANSPRLPAALQYIKYLASPANAGQGS